MSGDPWYRIEEAVELDAWRDAGWEDATRLDIVEMVWSLLSDAGVSVVIEDRASDDR